MLDTLERVERNALACLKPPDKLQLSKWIERDVRLPDDVSATPGPVRLWPFQHEIADAIGDPGIERVTLVKPVRVGFTTLLTGAIGNFVKNDPAPMLALLPTEADCRDYVVSDLEPVFEASGELGELLSGDQSENGRNTLMSRRFPGGFLKVVAAKAPRNLRRHNIRVLIIDEADGMEVTKEGGPIPLAIKRTLSFANRKIVIGSTPVFEDTSPVLRGWKNSDQRIFEVPCPECGGLTEIQWAHIKWDEGKPETAHFKCPHCEEKIHERHKRKMVQAGSWRALRPEVKDHAGFRMNALISLLANTSWAKLAAEFLESKNDPSDLQTFTNTILAQGWKTGGEELDDDDLAKKAEDFGLDAIPESVLFITVGVDVQHDRLEVTYLGHSEDKNAYVLGHNVIYGDWDDDTVWAELDEALKTKWNHPLGGVIGVSAAAVDSSDGTTTEKVYSFCFSRRSRKIIAIKGMDGNRSWLAASTSKKSGGKLHIVGVDTIKTHIRDRIEMGTLHFSGDLEPVWFEQLASEKMVRRYVRGQPKLGHERIPGRAAEALDCTVYAFASSRLVSPNWDKLRELAATPAGETLSRKERLAKMAGKLAS